jgi:hypothetical protein
MKRKDNPVFLPESQSQTGWTELRNLVVQIPSVT